MSVPAVWRGSEADVGQPGLLQPIFQQPAHVRRVQRRTGGGWERQPVLLPNRPKAQPLLGQGCTVLAQHRHFFRRQFDRSLTAIGFGLLLLDALPRQVLALNLHGHAGFIQVRIGPPKSGQLSKAHAGGGGKEEHGVKTVPGKRLQERGSLLGRQNGLLLAGWLGRGNGVGRVTGDQPLLHGLLQRRMDDLMLELHRARREGAGLAVFSWCLQLARVMLFEVRGAEVEPGARRRCGERCGPR